MSVLLTYCHRLPSEERAPLSLHGHFIAEYERRDARIPLI